MDPMGNSIGFVNTARLGCAYAKTTPLLLAGRSQMSPAEDWRGSAGSKMWVYGDYVENSYLFMVMFFGEFGDLIL